MSQATAPPSPPEGGPPVGAPRAPGRRARVVGALVAAPRNERVAGWLTTLGIAALVCVIAFGATGGLSLGPATLVELLLVLLGGAACLAAIVLAPRGQRVHGAGALAAFTGLAALTAVSISWAIQPNDAWQEANRTFAYLAAFAGAVALARLAPGRWAHVLGGILLSSVVLSLFALLSKVAPEALAEREVFARLRQPFDYWNSVGLAAALGLPAALWLGARRHGPPGLNALACPAIAVFVATILLAYSRGSLLAAVLGLALWFSLVPLRLRAAALLLAGGAIGALTAVWAFGQDALSKDNVALAERAAGGQELAVLLVVMLVLATAAGLAVLFAADARPLHPRQRRRIGTGLLVAVALVPVGVAFGLAGTEKGLGGSVSSAWNQLTDPEARSPGNDPARLTSAGSVRARYWKEALESWQERPIAGVGAGGYATARTKHRVLPIEVRHAHGHLVQVLADLGLAGLLLTLATAVAWFLAARRTLRGTAGAERAGLLTFASLVLVFAVHSFVDWTWFVPGNAVVALLAAGWVAGRGPGRPLALLRRPDTADRGRLLAAAAVALLTLATAWSVWQPLRAHERGADALDLAAEKRFDEARDLAGQARDINPLSIEPLLELASVEQSAGRPDEAEQALEEAVRLQPANWLPWLRLAEHQLYVLDRPEDAKEAIQAAIYLNPLSYDITQRYLDVLRASGDVRTPSRTDAPDGG